MQRTKVKLNGVWLLLSTVYRLYHGVNLLLLP